VSFLSNLAYIMKFRKTSFNRTIFLKIEMYSKTMQNGACFLMLINYNT